MTNGGKIRICHVVNIISGKSDGVYAHLRMLFQHLDKGKFEQFLVFQGDPAIEKEVRELGVTVFVLPGLKRRFSIAALAQLYAIVKAHRVDIIQAHLLKPYVMVGAVNTVLRKKAIFNYHGSFIRNREYYTFAEEAVYRLAHLIVYTCRSYQRVVVPSQASKRILLDETHLLPPVEVYYDGISRESCIAGRDDAPDTIRRLAPERHRIGIVSRFEPEKRIDVALQIARELLSRRSDVHFFILGDGELEARMRRLASELGLADGVTFLGYLPDAQKYLPAFDAVLITSDREGLPFLVWEAMAKGVPIVAPYVGGIGEIIEQEHCGKLFGRRNVPEAVSILDDLLNDGAMREEMGKRGRSAIEKKYNEQAFAKRFQSIYSELVNS